MVQSSSNPNLHYLSYLKFSEYSNKILTDFGRSALMWPDF